MKGLSKTYYKKVVKVLFESDRQINSNHLTQSSIESNNNKRNLPTYNHDKDIRTPAFIIPSASVNNSSYYDIFNERLCQVESSSQQELVIKNISQMIVRPKNKTFCNICKTRFQDYLEHTQSQNHINQLKNNKFQKKIDKFIKEYYNDSEINTEKKKLKKTKSMKKMNKQQQTMLKLDEIKDQKIQVSDLCLNKQQQFF